jgi:hypothetical protein
MFAKLRRWRPWALALAAPLLLAPAGCNTSATTAPSSTKPAQDKDKGGPKPPNPDVG